MPKNKIYLGAVHLRLYLFWCFSHHFKPRLQAIARQLSPETSPQSSTKAPASSAIICLLALQPTSFRSQAFINFPLSETHLKMKSHKKTPALLDQYQDLDNLH
ncbi:hypothetical protein ILYODFUR_009386 [Ilyodon furcidens]|uniref:Uncharacterized protein n=1 Tax=Ilyodon furcidens TaxID=33524 RepID=A0ABV0U590_9TELE